MPAKAAKQRNAERWTPYLFILPVALYLLLFQLYPLVQEAALSLTSTSLLSPQQHEYVGLDNYRRLVESDDFRDVLITTLVYVVACVTLAISIGLAAAMVLDAPFRGRGVARALVTVPWAAPPVAVALIFSWIYNAQYGVFNWALRSLGIPAGMENWLDSPSLALPAILLTTIWQIFPFATVVLLAALQGVSPELKEAAQIDGASKLAVFRAVVWPTIKPSVALLSLFLTIWSLRRFDLIWLLTQGGPIGATETLVIRLYREAFIFRDLGSGAAVGMVGLVCAFAVTLVYFEFSRRAERS